MKKKKKYFKTSSAAIYIHQIKSYVPFLLEMMLFTYWNEI